MAVAKANDPIAKLKILRFMAREDMAIAANRQETIASVNWRVQVSFTPRFSEVIKEEEYSGSFNGTTGLTPQVCNPKGC